MASPTAPLEAGLIEACDSPELFGVTLTPRQRELLTAVEAGDLLHVWAIGRRGGKSFLAALVALWMLLLRPEIAEHVRRRERVYAVAVATSLRQARVFVQLARTVVEPSPLLHGLVERVTDDELTFRGRRTLAAFPCTSRGGRGWPIVALFLDEAAHMLDTDGNQAGEPVFRSLVPSVAQFGDRARVIVASSPYGTDGFFADVFGRVERGELTGATCAQASTLEMRPAFETAALEFERQRDPEGFRAEYEAAFLAPGGAFLAASRIADAISRSHELPPGEVVAPDGAIDLGFVSDATALCIVGRDATDTQRLRLVLARAWKPDVGPLGFGPTLDEIADICLEYGVRRLFTDQHSATAAVEHLERRGISATVVPTTAQSKSEMFASLKTRLYGGELELYDHAELLAELRRIETVTTPGAATVRIRRLGSSHGDLATALALACSRVGGGSGKYTSMVARGSIPRTTDAGTTYADRVAARYAVDQPGDEELARRLGLPFAGSTRGRP